jgi:hypothetical protein
LHVAEEEAEEDTKGDTGEAVGPDVLEEGLLEEVVEEVVEEEEVEEAEEEEGGGFTSDWLVAGGARKGFRPLHLHICSTGPTLCTPSQFWWSMSTHMVGSSTDINTKGWSSSSVKAVVVYSY